MADGNRSLVARLSALCKRLLMELFWVYQHLVLALTVSARGMMGALSARGTHNDDSCSWHYYYRLGSWVEKPPDPGGEGSPGFSERSPGLVTDSARFRTSMLHMPS